MLVVTVIPLQKVAFEEELTYFTSLSVKVNDIVSITLRKRTILGLVIDAKEALENKMQIKGADFNLRKIEAVKGPSIIRNEFVASALDLAKYSILNKNFVLSHLIPEVLKEHYDEISKLFDESKGVRINDDINELTEHSFVVKYPQEKRIDVMNILAESIKDIVGVTLWCNNEQV
jgi:hypothetical protein